MKEAIYHLRDPRLVHASFATFDEIQSTLQGSGTCALSEGKVMLTTTQEFIRSYMKNWKWFDEGDGTYSTVIGQQHTVTRRMHLSVTKDPCPAGLTRIYCYEPYDPDYGHVFQMPYDHPFFSVNSPTKILEDGYYRAYDMSTSIPMDGMTDVTAILEIVNPHNLVDETFNDFWSKWASLTPTQQEKAGVAIARISNMVQEYQSIVGRAK